MSSDKGKGKAQTQSQAPLKQRTLLDSFVIRVPQKVVPLELESVNANLPLLATTFLQLGSSTDTTDVNVPVEVVEQNTLAKIPSNDSLSSPCLEDSGRRSPSIVIIEDTRERSLSISQKISVVNSWEHRASGKSKARPIIIDSSIKCSSSSERDKKPIHPFFLPKSAHTIQPTQIFSRKKFIDTVTLPNPSIFYPRGMPQHVRGLQTTFPREHLLLSKRPPKTSKQAEVKVTNYDFLKSAVTADEPSSISHKVQLLPIADNDPDDIIPRDIKASYPVVARLLDLKPGDKPTSNRPWADRWRPSCAQEVLGNEQSAIYLRDWLRALELQLEGNGANLVPTDSLQDPKKVKLNGKTITRGIKRPRVIRTVDKTRRKRSRLDSDDEEDNWIVYSDEEEEGEQIDHDQFDEFGEIIMNEPPVSSPCSPVHESSQDVSRKFEQAIYLGQLHNTILLAGPPGCGKTASVYACAEELGWDVFEVYPGIGRRNAVNIDNLIGEVGKNHLVTQSGTSGDSLKNFLPSKAKQKPVQDYEDCNALSQISPRKQGAIEMNSEVPSQEKQNVKSVQQSLILLEEVDILFKEDTNFWTTVTKIIGECRRPVVCTCNDLSLVPVRDLPLQATLFYTPCPEGPAACYLQALCAAEGYSVNWNDLLRLYSNPQRTNTINRLPDLRAAINTLQAISADAAEDRIEVSGQQEWRGSIPSSLVSPRISVKGSEIVSFLDGCVDGNFASTYFVVEELGNHIRSDDDEMGHLILCDRHAEDTASFGMYDRQGEILSAAARLVKTTVGMDVYGDDLRIETCRQKIRAGQKVAAREICRIAENGAKVSLEYLPYARQIVEAEDMQEAKERPRAGRLTRNSTRGQYVRMVELTADARSGLRW